MPWGDLGAGPRAPRLFWSDYQLALSAYSAPTLRVCASVLPFPHTRSTSSRETSRMIAFLQAPFCLSSLRVLPLTTTLLKHHGHAISLTPWNLTSTVLCHGLYVSWADPRYNTWLSPTQVSWCCLQCLPGQRLSQDCLAPRCLYPHCCHHRVMSERQPEL